MCKLANYNIVQYGPLTLINNASTLPTYYWQLYIYQIKPLKQEGNIVLENKLKILPSLNFLVFNCMPPEHWIIKDRIINISNFPEVKVLLPVQFFPSDNSVYPWLQKQNAEPVALTEHPWLQFILSQVCCGAAIQ